MARRRRRLPRDLDVVAWFLSLPLDLRHAALARLGDPERDALDRAWPLWAHDGQYEPPKCADGSDWDVWVIKAGRGFGKTLAGAQWITARIAEGEKLQIALVGATLEDARRVMVEGRSGLIAVAGDWVSGWHPSLRRLDFRTGAHATLFSGASPDMLRGPERHYAWCDELAKWEKPQQSWDMLQLNLRLGTRPRALITTTPRGGPVLRGIMADPATVTTGGPMSRNPHISARWKARVEALYAGTRLGRQELEGELLPDAAGALWTVELIEKSRLTNPPPEGEGDQPEAGGGVISPGDATGGELLLRRAPRATSPSAAGSSYARTLIAVDPPSGDGTCGIIACAREGSGTQAIAHILADHSVTARSPEGWARAVAAAAAAHATREVIAEANQGGKMVKAVLTTADPGLRVRLVHARQGKTIRAEPVAHLFEAGRVVIHGSMPELEAELLGMIAGGGYEGPGQSPDRADAMVWGVGEVMREVGARISVG
ncbi:terminase family protein [Sphingomonas sp. LB-2]|uniref:terminase large subunit domain-containing protein n=1 Tax=Sphingomonas caeni TaxID=2984949 RepID=UPI002230A636|nr:terminase family protein [Sphingomonas caeni]MCW3847867.1 terminase family protein [Sphingomonas caeni]